MTTNISVKPDTIFLEDLLKETANGQYKIPIFQREFIWETSQMLDLFDSILKGYPIGSLLFWKTQGYETKDEIGPYIIESKPDTTEVQYVLDGFQRISTLFGALMNPDDFPEKSQNGSKKFSIYFDINNNNFTYLKRDKKDSFLIPLYEIYDNRKLFNFVRKFDQENIEETKKDEYLENLRNLHDILHKYKLPYVEIKGGDIKSAVEIFSRINSTGTDISEDFMLSALTYDDKTGFLLSDSITEFISGLNIYNFEDLKRSVVLDCIANTYGMIYEDGKIYFDVKVEDLSQNEKLEWLTTQSYENITKAVEFLYNYLFVLEVRLLPYPAQLIFISEYFRANPNPTPEQYRALENWFWVTTYSNYFTLYSLSQQRSAYQTFCEFAQGKHPDGIYKVNPNSSFSTAKYPKKLNFTGVRPKALKLFYLNSMINNNDIQHREGIKDLFIFNKKDKNPANILVRLDSNFEEEPDKKKISDFIEKSSSEVLECHFITEEMVELYKNQQDRPNNIDSFLNKRAEYMKNQEKQFVEKLDIEFSL